MEQESYLKLKEDMEKFSEQNFSFDNIIKEYEKLLS
jgi:hypothetical protein